MKGDGRHSFNEKNGYLVLFIGTPYMDGRYRFEKTAHEVKERMESRYPHIRFEVVEVSGDFRVTDDVFWANHYEEIKEFEKNSNNIHWYRLDDEYKTEIRGGGPTGGGVAGSDYSW